MQPTTDEAPARMTTSPILVGREVLATIDASLVDLSVQLQDRTAVHPSEVDEREAPDKRVVQIRADRRDHATEPQIITLESGAARQLIAALDAAASVAEELSR